MKLKSTPYITLRTQNGAQQIDYTSARIIEYDNINFCFSYSTIIGVYIFYEGKRYYLQNKNSYSTTTAGKHHPRAAAIAIENNFNIIQDIKPETLNLIYNNSSDKEYINTILKEVLEESQERQDILKDLKNNDHDGKAILHAKYKSVITARKKPDHKTYKNGNYLNKYYCQAKFKYLTAIYYETNIKHIKYKRPAFYGSKGYKPEATGNKIETYIVNIDY